MSYSNLDARLEFVAQMEDALQTRDIEKAYIIRKYFAEIGDDEQADKWNNLARQWQREDDAYDEANNN